MSKKHAKPVFLGEGVVGEVRKSGRDVIFEESVEEHKSPTLRMVGEESLHEPEDVFRGPARETIC